MMSVELVNHVWQQQENDMHVKCIDCGASFVMSAKEFKNADEPINDMAAKRNIPPTCNERRVQEVMES